MPGFLPDTAIQAQRAGTIHKAVHGWVTDNIYYDYDAYRSGEDCDTSDLFAGYDPIIQDIPGSDGNHPACLKVHL